MAKRQIGNLEDTKEELHMLAYKANKLMDEIYKHNLQSPAIEEARKTQSAADRKRNEKRPRFSWEDDKERLPYFSIRDQKSFRDIQREAARIRAFLTSDTSDLAGAEMYTSRLSNYYHGAFTREGAKQHDPNAEKWSEVKGNRGRNYDTSRISEGRAKLAFKIYREIEEMDAYLIYGEAAYGSDTLIEEIYEMIAQNKFFGLSKIEKQALEGDVISEMRSKMHEYAYMRDPSYKRNREYTMREWGYTNLAGVLDAKSNQDYRLNWKMW